MTPKTAQEIFDQVLTHLRKQGVAATVADPSNEGTICAYRTPEGLSCAAGCLFPDSAYDPKMEGSGVAYLSYGEPKDQATELLLTALEAGGVDKHLGLVAQLQSAHDNLLNSKAGTRWDIQKWEDGMRRIAESQELHYTPKVETS